MCGYKGPGYVLDLDHRDPEEKSFKLSSSSHLGGRSWDTIKQEMAKCDVLCANCHRIKTYHEKDHL